MKSTLSLAIAAAMIVASPSDADQPRYLGAAIGANSMHEYSRTGQFLGPLIDGSTLGGPQHGCLDPTGEFLYIPQNNGGSSVQCYNVRTGELLSHITHTSFTGLTSVVFNPDGMLIISDFYGSRVWLWDIKTDTLVGQAVDAGHLINPHEVLFRDGNMYVADWAAGAIVQFDADGSFIRILNNGPHLVGPLGMVFTADGESLLVVNNFTANVSTFRLSDGAWTGDRIPSGSGLVWPEGIDIGHDGNLVVASPGNGTIRRYDRTTGALIETFQSSGAGSVDVMYIPPGCPADINSDGAVDVDDLVVTITLWGPCTSCIADNNFDGNVDVDDLVSVILSWGSCEE